MIMDADLEINSEIKELEEIINGFINEFQITQTPIEVSFRALLPTLKKTDRYTHLIHTYPAKLLLHIPYFFLNNELFSKPGDVVLDPFCGTGTVLLESIIAGRNALGADANPLARLIAKVKTTKLSADGLNNGLETLLRNRKEGREESELPDVVNVKYWFNERTISNLISIRNEISSLENEEIREFYLVCFSNLIKKVSYADPRISVPVRLNEKRYKENSASYNLVKKRIDDLGDVDVWGKFISICEDNIKRAIQTTVHLNSNESKVSAYVISSDARRLSTKLTADELIANESVDLIITSPPYAGAQKYIRSSSLSLGWLGLAKTNELKILDKNNIGRENFVKSELLILKTGIKSCDELIEKIVEINQVRAQIVSNYIIEMQVALKESLRVLKPDGFVIIIVGNNKVCNYEFNTQQYLTDYLEQQGMTLHLKLIDDIKSYGLMTKRNKTADIISREYILIFKKQRP